MAGIIEEDKEVRRMLISILSSGSYKPRQKTKYYQSVANKLSKYAKKKPPWSWRYISQVETGKLDPSPSLASAIDKLYKPKKKRRIRC